MLEHRLQINILVGCIVAAQFQKVLDDQVRKSESRLNAIERHTSSNVEDGCRANMIKMSMREHNRLHLLRRDMHRKTHMMIDHHTIVQDEIFLAHTNSKRGPAYFLAGTHEPNLHPNTESD